MVRSCDGWEPRPGGSQGTRSPNLALPARRAQPHSTRKRQAAAKHDVIASDGRGPAKKSPRPASPPPMGPETASRPGASPNGAPPPGDTTAAAAATTMTVPTPTMATTAAPPSAPQPQSANKQDPRPQPQQQQRPAAMEPNVLNVVLGDLLVKPWYPSFYPEELVGRRVERLYVCQWCFKYSKELIPFLGHTVRPPIQPFLLAQLRLMRVSRRSAASRTPHRRAPESTPRTATRYTRSTARSTRCVCRSFQSATTFQYC